MKQSFHVFLLHVFLLFFLETNMIYSMEENSNIGSLFEKKDVNGTFILYDLQKNTFVGYNKERSEKRYVPASTFKIVNSLIGLATGTVKTVDEIIPYTGPKNPIIAAWKNDMGLRNAIALSNVPIYQELARRIGLIQMKEYLKILHYGDESIGEKVDDFWLNGSLKISALEQVIFLKGLVEETLPVPKNIQKNIKDIILLEHSSNWKLYGKTGWQNYPDNGTGWFIGWLEKSNNIYIFALNMDMTSISDAPKRIDLTKACLATLGLIE